MNFQRLRILTGLFIFLLCLALSFGVSAQDDTPSTPTPEATLEILNATEQATEEATEIVVAPVVDVTAEPTTAPDVTTVPISDADRLSFSWTVVSQLALTIIMSFLAGGLSVGGGILLALRFILKSPVLSNMVEKLFLSQPPEKLTQQRALIKGLKEVAEGVEKLTDGVLESDTPPATAG
jgi:hypothetical protein